MAIYAQTIQVEAPNLIQNPVDGSCLPPNPLPKKRKKAYEFFMKSNSRI